MAILTLSAPNEKKAAPKMLGLILPSLEKAYAKGGENKVHLVCVCVCMHVGVLC